jgi:dTDP-4-dehydrorhamnose 3,5-epimerase
MHYQLPPQAEWKAITCTRGLVYDVVVDIRKGSPTFLQHFAVELGDRYERTLLVPAGYAHGFQVLTAPAEMLYVHSAAYCSSLDRGLRADDHRLAIHWPLAITEQSSRDASHPLISPDFIGIEL